MLSQHTDLRALLHRMYPELAGAHLEVLNAITRIGAAYNVGMVSTQVFFDVQCVLINVYCYLIDPTLYAETAITFKGVSSTVEYLWADMQKEAV